MELTYKTRERGIRLANEAAETQREEGERTNLGSESKGAEGLGHVSSERGEVENHEGLALEAERTWRRRKQRSGSIEKGRVEGRERGEETYLSGERGLEEVGELPTSSNAMEEVGQ